MNDLTALLMCGGKGTRLAVNREKPLVTIADKPMVSHVLSALENSAVNSVYGVVTSHTPETKSYLEHRHSVETIETAGRGYVADVQEALEEVSPPVLTVVSDIPLVTSNVIDRLQRDWARNRQTVTTVVPVEIKDLIGASVDDRVISEGYIPAGINVVDEKMYESRTYTSHDVRLAVNVNRPTDITLAERLHPNGTVPKIRE